MLSDETKASTARVRKVFAAALAAPRLEYQNSKRTLAVQRLANSQFDNATRDKVAQRLFLMSCKTAPPLLFLYGEQSFNDLGAHIQLIQGWTINPSHERSPAKQIDELVQAGLIAPAWAPLLLALNDIRVKLQQLHAQYVDCLLVLLHARSCQRVSLKQQLQQQEYLRLSLNYRLVWLSCIHLTTCTPLLSDLVDKLLPRNRRRLRRRDMMTTQAVQSLSDQGTKCWKILNCCISRQIKAPLLSDDVQARWKHFEQRCEKLDDRATLPERQFWNAGHRLVESICRIDPALRIFEEVLAQLN